MSLVPYWSAEGLTLYLGDCLGLMAEFESDSFDAIVTDPPYSLRFMDSAWDEHSDYDDDPAFGYYLAGLIDGEGCFRVQRHERGTHSCTFTLKLRRDDRAILERAARWAKAGTIADITGGSSNPMARWAVQDQEGCQRLVDILDKYPLRAKKALDYAGWREAVCEWTLRPRGNRWDGPASQEQASMLKARIESGRGYTEPPWSGNGYQDWCRLWSRECMRVLKPGGFMLSFGGTRTWHRLVCAIEDAGFEIRDSLQWIHGSGFPKGLDVSKAIDKMAGAEREVAASGEPLKRMIPGATQNGSGSWIKDDGREFVPEVTIPATPEAAEWEGWNVALKPAHEPIVLARKPLAGTVVQNVLAHGTGALNIGACRVATPDSTSRPRGTFPHSDDAWGNGRPGEVSVTDPAGRWPSNVLFSHSAGCEQAGTTVIPGNIRLNPTVVAARANIAKGAEAERRRGARGHGNADGTETVPVWICQPGCPVAELDRQSGVLVSTGGSRGAGGQHGAFSPIGAQPDVKPGLGDAGGASRFFPVFKYEAKAPQSERPRLEDGTAWPTVKPLELMRWLARLVTPPRGLILDPFCGTGTTAHAAIVEGFRCVLIEQDAVAAELAKVRLGKPIQPTLGFPA